MAEVERHNKEIDDAAIERGKLALEQMKAMRERDIEASKKGANAKENLGINEEEEEDDEEWKRRCSKLHPTPYKWNEEGEALLEECLIKAAFDFDSTVETFEKKLN